MQQGHAAAAEIEPTVGKKPLTFYDTLLRRQASHVVMVKPRHDREYEGHADRGEPASRYDVAQDFYLGGRAHRVKTASNDDKQQPLAQDLEDHEAAAQIGETQRETLDRHGDEEPFV